MGIFSGLEKLGIKKSEQLEIYPHEEEKVQETKKETSTGVPKTEVKEEEFLFDKTHICPLCDTTFTTRTVKIGKTKALAHDSDLRPRYRNIDVLKYDAIVCPKCGFAAITRYFKPVSSTQAKWIREQISDNFSGIEIPADKYTYEQAILMHKLALMTAVVKRAKTSERAYCCLKLAWLYRGMKEEQKDEALKADCRKNEEDLIRKAYEGYTEAFSTEAFPMCGMDELTVTYLVADLARQLKEYEVAQRWISKVIVSRSANERMKDKARMLKDQIMAEKSQEEEKTE